MQICGTSDWLFALKNILIENITFNLDFGVMALWVEKDMFKNLMTEIA